jgi:outer membrane protein
MKSKTTQPNPNHNNQQGYWTLALVAINMILTGFLLLNHFKSNESVVYVDAVKLVANYKGMDVAKKELEARSLNWNANLDTLQRELESTVANYEKTRNILSAREKQLTEELLRTKQEQFLNYQQMVKESFQKADQEYSTKVLGKVNEFIKRYGEEHGFTIIFAATQYGNIAYANTDLDITDELLTGLNTEYQVSAK